MNDSLSGGSMTTEQQLQELSDRGGGQTTIRPREGQDLEAFKGTISALERYEAEGRLSIVRRHQETYTGQRYIDRVTVELEPDQWARE